MIEKKDLADEANQIFNTLDLLSENIKTAEALLQAKNVQSRIELRVHEEEESLPRNPQARHFEETSLDLLGYTTRTYASLIWDIDEKSKKYRILFISAEIERIYYQIPGFDPDDNRGHDLKPRILSKKAFMETSSETRLMYAHKLPVFLRKFKEYLQKARLESQISDSDLNF